MKGLKASKPTEVTDAIIKDNKDEAAKQWVHIIRCAVSISQVVDGFQWLKGMRDWCINSALEQKLCKWKEEAWLKQKANKKRQ